MGKATGTASRRPRFFISASVHQTINNEQPRYYLPLLSERAEVVVSSHFRPEKCAETKPGSTELKEGVEERSDEHPSGAARDGSNRWIRAKTPGKIEEQIIGTYRKGHYECLFAQPLS